MHPPSIPSHVAVAKTLVTSSINGNENNFSLLDDDDDEEMHLSIVEGATPTLKQDANDDMTNDIGYTVATSGEHSYDAVLHQAAKWMAELEQIRDTTVWCHVENSFHRDVFAMMNIQTSFKYPSIA